MNEHVTSMDTQPLTTFDELSAIKKEPLESMLETPLGAFKAVRVAKDCTVRVSIELWNFYPTYLVDRSTRALRCGCLPPSLLFRLKNSSNPGVTSVSLPGGGQCGDDEQTRST